MTSPAPQLASGSLDWLGGVDGIAFRRRTNPCTIASAISPMCRNPASRSVGDSSLYGAATMPGRSRIRAEVTPAFFNSVRMAATLVTAVRRVCTASQQRAIQFGT